MSKCVDLTGKKFNHLTVIERSENSKNGNARWRCLCDCGKEKIIDAYDLKTGHTKSCGCWSRKILTKSRAKHRGRGTQLYNTWCCMKSRCYNPKHEHYKYYGGRGIGINDEWKNDFIAFRDWSLNNGYTNNLTLDRIDNNKGYSPENCRWATIETQQQNKRIYDNNTSGVKGVSFDKETQKWRAYIGYQRQLIYLGFFSTIKEASKVRKQAENKYWNKNAN